MFFKKKREPQFLKYEGNNEELFKKISADNFEIGDVIIVPETHSAVLLKDGEMLDTVSSGRHDIFEADAHDKKKKTSCTVDVIYMSKTAKLKVDWGTKRQFDTSDPVTNIPIKLGASGEFEVQIGNPRKAYLELIGATQSYSIDELKERLSGRMMVYVEEAIAKAMKEKRLSYVSFSEHKSEIAEEVRVIVTKMFEEDYGLRLFSFTIQNVLLPDEYKNKIEQFIRENKERLEAEERERQSRAEAEERERRARQDAEDARRRMIEDEERQIRNEERRDDREWEQTRYLEDLKHQDYDKYLETIRAIEIARANATAGAPAAGQPAQSGANKPPRKFCSKCGEPLATGDAFCPNCGTKTEPTAKVCPKCKKSNAPGAAFCSTCGTKLA